MSTEEKKIEFALSVDKTDEIANIGSSLKVGIRLRIEQLSDVNTVTQTYCARLVQVTDWLATEKDKENYRVDKENYTPERIVKLLWLNATEENVAFDAFDLVKADDGNEYNVRFVYCSSVFTESFECENFPFDVQDLSFVVDTDKDVRDVVFVASRINIDMFYLNRSYLALCDWEVMHTDMTLRYVDWHYLKTGEKTSLNTLTNKIIDTLRVTSVMIFRVQVKRKSFAFCIRIMFWMFLLSFMGFYIFGFEYEQLNDRLSFAIGLIFAIVAFQFIIGDSIPNLPYLTIVDKYNLAVFVFILTISFESVIVGWKSGTLFDNNTNISAYDLDYYFLIVLAIIYIIFHVLFIVYVARKIKFENEKIGKDIVKTQKEWRLDVVTTSQLAKIPFK